MVVAFERFNVMLVIRFFVNRRSRSCTRLTIRMWHVESSLRRCQELDVLSELIQSEWLAMWCSCTHLVILLLSWFQNRFTLCWTCYSCRSYEVTFSNALLASPILKLTGFALVNLSWFREKRNWLLLFVRTVSNLVDLAYEFLPCVVQCSKILVALF